MGTTKDTSSTSSQDTAETNAVAKPGPVDCAWGPWEEWSICSLSCDSGKRSRSREHAEDAAHGGEACHGKDVDEDSCNTAACPTTTTTLESFVEEIRAKRSEIMSAEEEREHGSKSGSSKQHKGLNMLLCGLT